MTLHNTYVNFHPKKFCFVVSNFQKALKDTLPLMIVPQKSKIDSSFFTVHDEKQLIIFNQPSQSVTKY